METAPEPTEGDQVIIFQHPQGRPKEFSGDKILHVEKPFVRYRADTDKGSSGSPVVTTTGLKLIAVHHGGKAEFNLRSGVPFVFVGSGKERLIQLLDYSSAAP